MIISNVEKNRLVYEATKELIKRAAKKGDILKWGKLLIPSKFELPFCDKLHNYFVDIKDEPFSDTEAPRNYAKSTIKCFLIPLFMALVTPDKYLHYLNIQSTTSKAIDINIIIKNEIETNELLIDIYGNQVSDYKWTEKQFILNNGVVFSAKGAGESIRGLNIDGKRPDYIIIDDLYDDEDAYNPLRIKKKNLWFWGSLYPARAKTKYNCVHVQGTVMHKSDLLHQLRNKENIVYKSFKAIEDFSTKTVLWKELNTYEQLIQEKENMGSSLFFREYQNEVRDDETSYIKESWIRYYKEIPGEEKVVEKILGIDPSIGENKNNDYTGMAVIYKTKIKDTNSYRWYILDIVNEHLTMQERINTAVSLDKRHNFNKVIIEAISGFKDFAAEMKRTTNLPIREKKSVKDKMSNLEANSSKFENSKVFINEKLSTTKISIIVEQLINNIPTNDDVRDAIFLAIEEHKRGINFIGSF